MSGLSNNGLESLYIDGKAVKKASLGGKVFFEKHDYDLSVTSDKSILSYYDQDSCTITASLTDWGEPLEGETVVFSCDSALYSQQVTIWSGKVVSDFRLSNITDATNQVIFIYGDNDNSIWMNNHFLFLKNNGISTHIGEMDLTLGIQVEGDTLTYFDSSNNECTVDISMIDKENRLLNVTTSALLELYQISAVTDVNGECSVSYDSKGTGDINIKAKCMNLVKTYSICDALKVVSSSTTTGGTGICSVSNMPSDFEVSWKMRFANTYANRVGIQTTNTNDARLLFGLGTGWGTPYLNAYAYFNGSTETINSFSVLAQSNTDYSCKLKYENGLMSQYIDDVLYQTGTVTSVDLSTIYVWHRDYKNGNTVTVTDLIIKPL